MQKLTVCLAYSVTVLVGCSSTHNVQRDAAAEWIPEASERLVGSEVTVSDRTGRVLEGKVLSLGVRQIRLSNGPRDTSVCLPIDSVLSINSGSNAGSVIWGIVIGFATGGLVGAIIGAIAAPEQNSSSGMFFPHGLGNLHAAGGMFIGVPVGGVLGGVIVGMNTKTHDYVIVESAETPQRVSTRP